MQPGLIFCPQGCPKCRVLQRYFAPSLTDMRSRNESLRTSGNIGIRIIEGIVLLHIERRHEAVKNGCKDLGGELGGIDKCIAPCAKFSNVGVSEGNLVIAGFDAEQVVSSMIQYLRNPGTSQLLPEDSSVKD